MKKKCGRFSETISTCIKMSSIAIILAPFLKSKSAPYNFPSIYVNNGEWKFS